MSNSTENVLYVKKGAPVGVPAPGAVGLFVDSTGAVKSIDETGATASIGGGTVTTDGTTITGDGSVGDPLVAAAQFGQDVTVPINNSAANPVPALRLIASLTTATAGSEVSQWLVRLLKAGAPVDAFQFGPSQFQVPGGSTAAPGLSFLGKAGYGMSQDTSVYDGLSFSANGNEEIKVSALLRSVILTSGHLLFSTSQTERIDRSGLSLQFKANNVESIRIDGTGIGFFAHSTVGQQTVTGSRGGNAAVASLITAIAATGLVIDGTTA